jgi:hypothetical protein
MPKVSRLWQRRRCYTGKRRRSERPHNAPFPFQVWECKTCGGFAFATGRAGLTR